MHEFAHQLRFLLDERIGRGDALRHVREVLVGGDDLDRDAGRADRRNPVGHAGHACRLAGGDELPHAGRPDRLDAEVVLGEADAGKEPEQRIEGRVLIRHHADGLALEVGRLADAGILAHDELHEPLAAEHRDDLDGHAVAAHHDRSVGDDAAERRVARAHLLGHVDAAARHRIAHVEPGLREVPLAFRELNRREGGKHGRCREQIGDLFQLLRRYGLRPRDKADRGPSGEHPAARKFGQLCGHFVSSSERND